MSDLLSATDDIRTQRDGGISTTTNDYVPTPHNDKKDEVEDGGVQYSSHVEGVEDDGRFSSTRSRPALSLSRPTLSALAPSPSSLSLSVLAQIGRAHV